MLKRALTLHPNRKIWRKIEIHCQRSPLLRILLESSDAKKSERRALGHRSGDQRISRTQGPMARDQGKPPSPPGSPGRNSPLEKAGEPPALGKKNDISRHSYSRYNTISYRRIRKGNTKQRIDEFESMMHL
ncbi:hypothetical protein EK904_007632 [Melospiza melodia maxima]|nr:hypothetical protein EK904_007632 [Melospiza melodia maxima]